MKLLFAPALFLLALSAAPAQADVRTDIYGSQNTYVIPFTQGQCAGCVSALTHTVNYSDNYVSNTTTIDVYAMADYGVLKASAAVSGQGAGAQANTGAEARFFDHFQIDAPGLSGQKGYFTAQVAMPFTSSILNPAMTGEGLDSGIIINPYNNVTESYQLFAGDGGAQGSFVLAKHNGEDVSPDAPMILKVPFFYGVPIAIQGSLTTRVFGQLGSNGGSFSAVMDAAHSLYWEGISSVTDGAGNAVAGYTLVSDSGTDWTRSFAPAPVPEPATGFLMFAGLVALGLRRRRTVH